MIINQYILVISHTPGDIIGRPLNEIGHNYKTLVTD
jgi:hypothetical protein